MIKREPGAAIAQVLGALLEYDDHLYRVDAHERSLTHHFGLYLQGRLHGWHVDCDYNRNGLDPQRYLPLLELMRRQEVHGDVSDIEGKTAFSDVIAHHRDTTDNYLVIELNGPIARSQMKATSKNCVRKHAASGQSFPTALPVHA